MPSQARKAWAATIVPAGPVDGRDQRECLTEGERARESAQEGHGGLSSLTSWMKVHNEGTSRI